jgi:hypothetical protein
MNVVLHLPLVTELVASAIPLAKEGEVLITGGTRAGGPGIDQGQIDVVGSLRKVGDRHGLRRKQLLSNVRCCLWIQPADRFSQCVASTG